MTRLRSSAQFEFYCEGAQTRWLCQLRDDGESYGVEAQFDKNEEHYS